MLKPFCAVVVAVPWVTWPAKYDEPATSKAKTDEGVEVPILTTPFWLTPLTMKDGEVEPWLETMNAGWVKLFISSDNSPIGVVEPIPIRPIADERVEIEKIGMAVEVVAKVKALSTPLTIVVVEDLP